MSHYIVILYALRFRRYKSIHRHHPGEPSLSPPPSIDGTADVVSYGELSNRVMSSVDDISYVSSSDISYRLFWVLSTLEVNQFATACLN